MSGSMYTTLLPHIGYIDIRAECTVLHSHCRVDQDRYMAFRTGDTVGHCYSTDHGIVVYIG